MAKWNHPESAVPVDVFPDSPAAELALRKLGMTPVEVIESDESYEASKVIMEQVTAQNAVQTAITDKLEGKAGRKQRKG